jgi:hypothetical protein
MATAERRSDDGVRSGRWGPPESVTSKSSIGRVEEADDVTGACEVAVRRPTRLAFGELLDRERR